MRIACVLIPNLAVQIALVDDPALRGKPLVIGGLPFEVRTVYDASPEALACGIKPGMPLHQAYALRPEAIFLPADDKKYEAAFEEVINVLEKFSPVVDIGELGCAYADVSGIQHERELACEISAAISAETGLSSCLGISSGKFFSRIAAFTSTSEAPVIVSQGKEKDFVAPFSVELLPCSDETKERLSLLGIRFIGQLRQFSREALIAQFGSDGIVMHELAHGFDRTPLIPRKKRDVLTGSAELDPPAVTFIEILQTCQTVLERVLGGTNMEGKLCREILVRVRFASGTSQERRLSLKQPTNSRDAILGRLRTWLEGVRFPAPAVQVELSLCLTREQSRGLSLWPEQQKVRQELTKAANELKLRLGHQPIKKVQVVRHEAILPERRFRLTEVLE